MRTLSLSLAAMAALCLIVRADTPRDLVACYPMDEGKGNITANITGKEPAAKLIGAAWGKRWSGAALEFDGKQAYLDCGDASQIPLQNKITVCAWVKLNGKTAKEATLVGINPDNWSLGCVGERVYFYIASGRNYCYVNVQPHQWIHLAGAYDGKTMRLYINGVERTRRELPPGTKTPNKGRVVIGGGSKTRGFFNGAIDDVRVYNRDLSVKDISLLLQPSAAAVIALKGERLGLSFSARDFHLESFTGQGDFGEMAAPFQITKDPLWRIVLMSNRGRPETDQYDKRKSRQWHLGMLGMGRRVTIDAKAECVRSHEIEQTAEEARLRLHWQGLDVGEEKGVLDVTTTIRIPTGSALALWTLEMKNRSKVYGIWEYNYPILNLAPPDPALEKNFFLNTYRMGEIIPDPFHAAPVSSLYVGHNTKAGQFTALYGANKRGFFYGSRDPEGWQKRFDLAFNLNERYAQFSLWNAPLNLGDPGEDFKMPFPVAAGFFTGDWYDACQVYREWAIKQVWCRKGTVAQRDDIPQWLKDCCIVLRQDTRSDALKHGGLPMLKNKSAQNLANNTKNFLRCIDLFGKNTASVWYTWWIKNQSKSTAPIEFLQNTGNGNDGQLVDPVPGVLEANRKIAAASGYPLAYINGVLYDVGDPEDFVRAKPAAARDLMGDIYMKTGDPQACTMCSQATWWRERYGELCRRAIKDFGFKGVYWDSYGKDGYRCFAADHGHSYGGGTKWIQGERELGAYTRKLMKEADPEAVTSAEASSEEFIDLVDTRLCAVILRSHVAPIFSCIYHDYQLFFGRKITTGMDEPEFSMNAGYSFNLGSQFGRYFIHGNGIDADNAGNTQKTAFLKSLVESKRAAKEFLNLGRMMRPPQMLSELPELTAAVWYKKQKVTLPAVLCSAWQAANGDIGLVFVNCSYDPLEFTYQIDTVEYGFPQGTKIKRHLRKPTENEPCAPLNSGIIKEKDRLPGHGIKIIVLSKQP